MKDGKRFFMQMIVRCESFFDKKIKHGKLPCFK